jgi:Protein of unknown function (DUF742)
MSSGPDPRLPAEPTFADVMNGFSFDASRSPRRRRWGRRRDAEPEPEQYSPTPTPAAAPVDPYGQPYGILPPTGPIDAPPVEPEQAEQDAGASAVRPYTWTRGRTKSGFDLAIETLLSTSRRGREQMGMLQVEHRAVAELCGETRSVAEVAALLSLPLGVARVLLGDMAGLGLVTVHQTASSAGNAPDLALMERVLSGLRRL